MAHLIDRHLIERANAAVLLSMVWAALAACVIGAVIYDIYGSPFKVATLAV